ncbi:MAG: NADH:ubiquinone reductase (Na(+)-transporting) subunit C [Bacteroidetes bacterium]|nr:NADH:ubiquinone reductase (Na(+)-transporting) subunit C [Bacteroidota bacterium]
MADTNSTNYTLTYAAGLIVMVALALAFASEYLKPIQAINIAFDKKTKILQSVGIIDKERAEEIYNAQIEELVVNMHGDLVDSVQAFDINLKREAKKSPEDRLLPLYVFTKDDSSQAYIIPMRGSGLWGPISGFIAIDDDFNTIYGAAFNHDKETPGLGAEIKDNPWFRDQFPGRKLFDDEGNFVSVSVKKNATVDDHTVNSVSGATITSKGVDEMIRIYAQLYLSYFDKIKIDNHGE